MSDGKHTIELDSMKAKWLLDAIRWQKELCEEKNHKRNARKFGSLESDIQEQLPEYVVLAELAYQ